MSLSGLNLNYILILLNAIFGAILLEISWAKLSRFRNPNAELDEHFPAFRRTDALTWRKWKLYPGAVTIMIPRFIFFVFTMTI